MPEDPWAALPTSGGPFTPEQVSWLRGELGLDPTVRFHSSGTPIGSVITWMLDAPPDGWLLINGGSYSKTTYSTLWGLWSSDANLAATDGGNPDNFIIADWDDATLIYSNATPGTIVSAGTITLSSGQLPAHSHAAGTLATATAGSHHHGQEDDGGPGIVQGNATTGLNITSGGGGYEAGYTSSDGDHTHTITGSTANTGSGTSIAVPKPKHVQCHFIVRAL